MQHRRGGVCPPEYIHVYSFICFRAGEPRPYKWIVPKKNLILFYFLSVLMLNTLQKNV